jgi:carboxyl-terminal processing protease
LLALALAWLASGCSSPQPQAGPNYLLLQQAYNTIQRRYVDRAAIQPDELTYGALGGMVDALGDTGHSAFLTPDMVKELRTLERGEFKGVGLEIQAKAGRVVVVSPIDDSPAQRAGVRAGDVILKVDGQDVTDWPLTRVTERITGRVGTTVTLTIQDARSDQTREVKLKRTSIRLHPVSWQRLPGTDVAHLRVASFDTGAAKELRHALKAMNAADIKAAILDLRNNPGGMLDEAVSVASQFLAGGDVLLSKDSEGTITPVAVEKGGLATNLPLAVLVNEGSASGAEIVAGAIDDAQRGPLVGATTFGTGTVLGEFKLSGGSALLLAVEEWLTPSGRSFWHKGLKPQHEVSMPPDTPLLLPQAERDMTPEQLRAHPDQQLLRALELLPPR